MVSRSEHDLLSWVLNIELFVYKDRNYDYDI